MIALYLVAIVFTASAGALPGLGGVDDHILDADVDASSGVLNWARLVTGYEGAPIKVNESAKVDLTNENILFSATDLDLRGTPFYRSQSLLDFNSGMMAIKPLGSAICLIAPVLDTLDNIIKDLNLRDGVTLETEGLRTRLLLNVEDPLTVLNSPILTQFCGGLDLVKLDLVDVDTVLNTVNFLRWAPLGGVLGPLDIFIKVAGLALNAVPTWLLNWVGPFGAFP